MLLETEDGSLVSLAAVARFGPEVQSQDSGPVRHAYDPEGRSLGLCGWRTVEQAKLASRQAIPAASGWLLVTHSDVDDEDFNHSTEPVIGWLLGDPEPVPLVASGTTTQSDTPPWFVVAPPGSGATVPGDGSGTWHSDLAEGLRHAEAAWREMREARVAQVGEEGDGG
jgi:hypothetical protein